MLVDALEHLLDLFVQLGAVGDQQYAGVLDMLANPFRQPNHGQRLAAALRVPDDAALTPRDVGLGGTHAKILIMPAGLLDTRIEHNEIVDDLE